MDTLTVTQICIHMDKHMDTNRFRLTLKDARMINEKTGKRAGRLAATQTDRQTDRKVARKTDRRTD